MSASSTISVVAILSGAVVLALAANGTRSVLPLVRNDAQLKGWRTLLGLMLFFILGYVGAVFVVLAATGALLELVTGVVFLAGALFVLLVAKMGQVTMRDLDGRVRNEEHRAEELKLANEKLETTLHDLERLNEDLGRSNKELEQFAYVASHDLQEPLRKIKAFGDLLVTHTEGKLDDEATLYVDRMRNASGRMSALIDDLLTFSRAARKMEDVSEIDLAALVDEVLVDLEERLTATEGKVEVATLPTIKARRTQMRQLLQNLISNALKFHRAGVPPEVKIGGRVIDDPKRKNGRRMCELLVEDNGIGFESKHEERIFGIFQRLHGRGKYEGTGVGLSICQRIVAGHGGKITGEGRPGEGAKFVITLPLDQVKEDGELANRTDG